jgi:hypothetical protein
MANSNAVNMNALLREINATRRANRNMRGPSAPLNPNAPVWRPALNPAAPEWTPREVPDEQVMNSYLREMNQVRRANMPAQRRRKTRKNRKSRKSRKGSRRA